MESLIKLFKAEPFEKEYTIGEVKFSLRILTRNEYDDVMSRANIGADNILSKEAQIKSQILGYSLSSINGVKMEDIPEIKEILSKNKGMPVNIAVEYTIGKMNYLFVDKLFDFYNQLVEDNEASNNALKKD